MAKKTLKTKKAHKISYKRHSLKNRSLVIFVIAGLVLGFGAYIVKTKLVEKAEINMVVEEDRIARENTERAQKAFTANLSWPFNTAASFGKIDTWRTPVVYPGKPFWKDGFIVWNDLKPNNKLILSGRKMNFPEAQEGYQNTMLIQIDPRAQIKTTTNSRNLGAFSDSTSEWRDLDPRQMKISVSFGRNRRVVENDKRSENYGQKVTERVTLGSGSGTVTTNQGMQYLMIKLPRKIDQVIEDITITFDVMNSQEAVKNRVGKGVLNVKIDGIYIGKTFLRPENDKVVKSTEIEIVRDALAEPTE